LGFGCAAAPSMLVVSVDYYINIAAQKPISRSCKVQNQSHGLPCILCSSSSTVYYLFRNNKAQIWFRANRTLLCQESIKAFFMYIICTSA
jgi:hypothetical protein